jgi:hypothetical protein
VPKQDYQQKKYRILITRLSTYRDTAASFTHKVLYQIARSVNDVFPDFSWLPPPRDTDIFDADKIPWLIGTTSKQGPAGFDLVAISNAVVQELINLPTILSKSGIPLLKSQRIDNPSLPLIILGGANATGASALFTDDPPIDGIFAGSDAGAIFQIFDICRDSGLSGNSKRETLDRLHKIPGFIEPDRPAATNIRHSCSSLHSLLSEAPVMYEDDYIGVGNIPISEGCRSLCSFCLESWTHKPYREFDTSTVISAALKAKAASGLHEIDLFSFNFNMHSSIYDIIFMLLDTFPSIGLKSQRFDILGRDPEMLKVLHLLGKTSLTCGLEGVSSRLRRFLNKNLSDKDITNSLSAILKAPIRQLKIFLVVTGLESDADITEFEKLLHLMNTVLPAEQRRPRVIFSCTPLVRFPLTPLKFADTPPPANIRNAASKIGSAVHAAGFEYRLAASVDESLVCQAMVRAHDQRIFAAIVEAVHATGFVYYDAISKEFTESLFGALRNKGLSIEGILASPPDNAEVPWQYFDNSPCSGMLKNVYDQCVESRDLVGQKQNSTCNSCKTCSTGDGIDNNLRIVAAPSGLSRKFEDKIRTIKAQEQTVRFLVDVGKAGTGVPRALIATVLASALMQTQKELTFGYRGFRGSFIASKDPVSWIEGQDILDLAFLKDAAAWLSVHAQEPDFIEKVTVLMGKWASLTAIWNEPEPSVKEFTFSSAYQLNEKGFLAQNHIKFTRTRIDANTIRYVFPPDTLRKKIIKEITVSHVADRPYEVKVVPGAKFNKQEFLETGFVLPDYREWIHISARARLTN